MLPLQLEHADAPRPVDALYTALFSPRDGTIGLRPALPNGYSRTQRPTRETREGQCGAVATAAPAKPMRPSSDVEPASPGGPQGESLKSAVRGGTRGPQPSWSPSSSKWNSPHFGCLDGSTGTLNANVWEAPNALRPTCEARPTTPSWTPAVCETPQRRGALAELFPFVEHGEAVRGSQSTFNGQRFRRYECTVCAAYNAALSRIPALVGVPRLSPFIEVPIHSGEGDYCSRPGPFAARRVEYMLRHAHGCVPHNVFTSTISHTSDIGAALNAVTAAVERLDTVVVQSRQAASHPSAMLWVAQGEVPVTMASRSHEVAEAVKKSQTQGQAQTRCNGRPKAVAPVTARTAHIREEAMVPRSMGVVSPRDGRMGGLDSAHSLSRAPRAPAPINGAQGIHASREETLTSRPHLSYIGATAGDSDSDSEVTRPVTPPSCSAPIAARRRRALAYAVAFST